MRGTRSRSTSCTSKASPARENSGVTEEKRGTFLGLIERIFQRNHRAPVLKSDHWGHAIVNPRQHVFALCVLVQAAPSGHKRRAEAFLSLVVADVGAFDAKLVRGREIVERRILLRVKVSFACR